MFSFFFFFFFFFPGSFCFGRPIPPCLFRITHYFFDVFVQIQRLGVLGGRSISFFEAVYVITEHGAQFRFGLRNSGLRFLQILLHFSISAWASCFSYLSCWHICISSKLLSLSPCLSSIAASSTSLYNYDSLLALPLQLLLQVFVFSFTFA